MPPGPPVLSTLVAEIYGPDYERQREIAQQIREIFEQTAGRGGCGLVHGRATSPGLHWMWTRKRRPFTASARPRSPAPWNWRLAGKQAGLLHQPLEKEDVPIILRLPLADRAGIERLKAIKIAGAAGSLVPLSNWWSARKTLSEQSIYHKNLMPVVYVIGDVAGEKESPVYAILEM